MAQRFSLADAGVQVGATGVNIGPALAVITPEGVNIQPQGLNIQPVLITIFPVGVNVQPQVINAYLIHTLAVIFKTITHFFR